MGNWNIRPTAGMFFQRCFFEIVYLLRILQGYNVKTFKATQDKVTRALPVSSQAEAGNIKILQAPWNEDFLRELEKFPEGAHDDIVDAFSGAFLMLTDTAYNLEAMTSL
jgi:predicted phage terminase large subunit-like protein